MNIKIEWRIKDCFFICARSMFSIFAVREVSEALVGFAVLQWRTWKDSQSVLILVVNIYDHFLPTFFSSPRANAFFNRTDRITLELHNSMNLQFNGRNTIILSSSFAHIFPIITNQICKRTRSILDALALALSCNQHSRCIATIHSHPIGKTFRIISSTDRLNCVCFPN